MPDRVVRHAWQGFRHHSETILLIMLCVVLVLAIWGWQKAANAQNRVNSIEVARAAEFAATEKARKTGEVVACFTTARTRPALLRLLRNINASETNIPQRRKVNLLIEGYAAAPVTGIKGRPTRAKCIAQAKDLGVPYKRYDFDPKTLRLLHPVVQK